MAANTTADLALVLFAIFGALGFGWRSWVQYQRTGSTGFRGVSGRIGSTEWLAGMGFAAGLVIAVSAFILQRTNVVEPVGFLNNLGIQVTGILLAAAGIAATVYAQLAMGDSWRIGVDEQETTALIASGPFGWVRNPVFTAMLMFGLGVVMLAPNIVVLTGFILLLGSIEVQVRRVEEPYLLRTHGDAYRAYAASVGRFIPGVGLIR